ncbi:carboxy-terminus containing arginine-tRNA-protein transferase (macronuclear) [Tetrahymena thermophila SB210]|uniref:arginyltransferase n=1 Tax=Tetrahymena thermophila (strain SB210) TaxID=312017 RepID=I7LTI2_TETTS|nr:carboxy-terminus containing arginine-tRNA-protein transferase [Tetrahymena thermophila SB210]EAR85294.2 carboxy-terminus containing arginine-tRNA-protein transferase [Tetrahymena thermophila SB210]|eukprot:XP_001032957.2 carboxy-terminus containing arginine-tRNA-protein transferase [Tetrahymena thermophila SB210]
MKSCQKSQSEQICCLKLLFIQVVNIMKGITENSQQQNLKILSERQLSNRINIQKEQKIKEFKKKLKMQPNQIENQNRYIIDVRRIHQELSNGQNTACKYCGLYDSKYHCGFEANLLLPDIYMELSNKGFFRSGKYFWKQNPYLSCCKEYAIRMNVLQFQISHHQKKTFQKFASIMHNEIKQQISKKNINNNDIDDSLKNKSNSHNLDNKNKGKESKNEHANIQENQKQNYQIKQIKDLLNQLVLKLFIGEEKGFKKVDYDFKVFLTQGKSKESDYYSNVLQIIYIQNKEALESVDKLIEKYQNQVLDFLHKECSEYAYSIHPVQKLILFKLKENQNEQLLKKNKEKEQLQQNIKSIGQKNENGQQKQMKQVNEKKQLIPKNEMQKYVNEDGSIVFDEFSPKYIKIGDLEISLEENQFDQEIYQIHCDYFKSVHQREPQSVQKFINDKCIQIIEPQIIQSKVNSNMQLYTGTFFFKYKLKGEIIAVSHVDILPEMFMSQYFFYKPELKQSFKLGINSALIEIEYVKRMQKFFPQFLYFNFVQFIPRTTKMNYKADFQKQQILCPETCKWVDLTLEMKKQLYENPADNPRLASKEESIQEDHDFSDMNIEQYLYENFMMYINERYLMIQDLIPESQPQILINLACLLQAMGKKIFNSLTFGY